MFFIQTNAQLVADAPSMQFYRLGMSGYFLMDAYKQILEIACLQIIF